MAKDYLYHRRLYERTMLSERNWMLTVTLCCLILFCKLTRTFSCPCVEGLVEAQRGVTGEVLHFSLLTFSKCQHCTHFLAPNAARNWMLQKHKVCANSKMAPEAPGIFSCSWPVKVKAPGAKDSAEGWRTIHYLGAVMYLGDLLTVALCLVGVLPTEIK